MGMITTKDSTEIYYKDWRQGPTHRFSSCGGALSAERLG